MTQSKIKTDAANVAAPSERVINPALIDGVEVALDGFLGSARLTVGELTALTKGAVVTLDAPLNGMVELRLNGVQVGRGELVAVGNHFAVRLTEFAS